MPKDPLIKDFGSICPTLLVSLWSSEQDYRSKQKRSSINKNQGVSRGTLMLFYSNFYALLFFIIFFIFFFSFSTARRYLSCQRNCLLLRLFKTCRKLNFLCCNYLPFSLQSKIDFPAYWAMMVTQFVKIKFLMMKLIANVVWKISWDFLPTTWK